MIVGITDRNLYAKEAIYLQSIDGFLKSDIDYLIIRDTTLTLSDYYKLIQMILTRNPAYKHKIIVHTHVEVALFFGITHVHLPERFIGHHSDEGNEGTINYSYSLHPSSEDLDDFVETAFFIMISPVYETTCKSDSKPMNRELLYQLRNRYRDKLVLLGGLDKEKILALKKEGFLHFALRSGLESYKNYTYNSHTQSPQLQSLNGGN